jgi:hypothetical protein
LKLLRKTYRRERGYVMCNTNRRGTH